MNNISFSIDALNDLEKITYYIEEELHNHISGKKIVTKIIKSIKALKDFPNRGKPLKNVVKMNTDYKYIVCGNYYIFYTVEIDNIKIIRIIHCNRNYIEILF